MISSIHLFILILLSIHQTYGSITSKKRKTLASSQEVATGEGYAQPKNDVPLQDPLNHRSKRQTIESVESDPSTSLDNDTETIPSETRDTPLSNSVQQRIPSLNGKISKSNMSRKKGAALLRDSSNVVEEVQPKGVLEEVHDVPLKVHLEGGTFSSCYPIPEPSTIVVGEDFDMESIHEVFGGHHIDFHPLCRSNLLLLQLSLSSFITSGQIAARLVGFNEPFDRTKRQQYLALNPVRGSLINGKVLSLGRLECVQKWAQTDFCYIYLMIRILIEPTHYDVITRKDVLDQMVLKETQDTSDHIKRLLDEERYDEIEELGDCMSNDMFLKCVCPFLTTLNQYNKLANDLRSRGMIPTFFRTGNMNVIKEIILSKGYNDDDDNSYFEKGDLEVALNSIFKDGHFERFADLLEIRRLATAEVDKNWETETSFQAFMSDFRSKIDLIEDSLLIKHFLTDHNELNNKYPEVLDAFCGELVYNLDTRANYWNEPWAAMMVDDLVGQPFLLTPTSFCFGFLINLADEHRARDDKLAYFIEHGWAEAIQLGLKERRNYTFGGKCLWRFMTRRYPDKCSGEFPHNDELRAAVCSKFPTKQQVEERWFKKNLKPYFQALENDIDILSFLPKVLWNIISEYAFSWLDIDYNKIEFKIKNNEESEDSSDENSTENGNEDGSDGNNADGESGDHENNTENEEEGNDENGDWGNLI